MYFSTNEDGITATEAIGNWANQVVEAVFGTESDHYIHAKVDF